ncbi:MAG: class I SAM-dependent methyltransferase [Actinomycetota bacterium]
MLRRAYDATWGRAFALGYDRFQRASEEAGMREIRREVLAAATGRTLEIGAGSGLNHDLYPGAVTELVLSEPFGPMAEQLRKKTARLDGEVEVVQAPGESLPFPDASFDTVALTMVLCSAPDPGAVVAEAARVLRPGGRFLFLEHVRSPEPGLARWQDRLHGPWYVFGHGCHCNRDSLRTIENSPLELERSERGSIPHTVPLVRPMVTGSARAGA